ncbi:MAG: hypothetical protein JSS66_02645 [Armatimonadetes bacterium]|nr:hypothetical protein [Armatimonadota bacterium]
MGRNLTFLLIGIAAGMVLMAGLERLAQPEEQTNPESLADKISDKLDSLEQRLQSA